MPLVLDLDSTNPRPSISKKNSNDALAITTGNDTITITVNPGYPRVVVFRPTVDAGMSKISAAATKFPILIGEALHLEISETTIFHVAAATTSGTMHVLVVR